MYAVLVPWGGAFEATSGGEFYLTLIYTKDWTGKRACFFKNETASKDNFDAFFFFGGTM
ncbi:hypothetical protein C900_04956 [Fulvivirga imtechensis AK7]|uniref:Uncharacterized protein n=1 Tax=Fulvivirga imtechensis AK7 TaxID=1237149 RepID=L8JPI1_9BACT|nr:hypothetical protein C900_04956 [Fulvivirga imtechensis AK7]